MSMSHSKDNAQGNPLSEDIFLAWFFSLPDSTDVAAAARVEISRIDEAALRSEHMARLRAMLVQASCPQPFMSRDRRRQRH